MGAGAKAVESAADISRQVTAIGTTIGCTVHKRVRAGNTIWGTRRDIKVVLERNGKQLGVECFCQHGPGTAYQKGFAKIEDVKNYPFPGVVVYGGKGIPVPFRGVLSAHGAVPMEEFQTWACRFFRLKTKW